MFLDAFADFFIHGPTGAAFFNDASGLVEADVADFRFAGNCAVIDLFVHNKAAADSAAHGDIKNGIGSAAGTFQSFSQTGGVRIIVDADGSAGNLLKPLAKFEITPAFDLMRATDFSGAPIDGAAETDAHAGNFLMVQQLGKSRSYLASNPFAAFAFDDIETAALGDFGELVAENNLQLGAADLDSDVELLFHSQRRLGNLWSCVMRISFFETRSLGYEGQRA